MFLQEKKRILTLNPSPIRESPAPVEVTMADESLPGDIKQVDSKETWSQFSTIQRIMACKRTTKCNTRRKTKTLDILDMIFKVQSVTNKKTNTKMKF